MSDPSSKPLLIIAGPTGVGKSAVALELARATGAGILSADSMQVYRGMAIGTAQPTAAEQAEVPHFLVGHVEPGEEYHVARFVEEANIILEHESAAGRSVIVAGGTGLFLRHLVHGIFQGAPRNMEIRERLKRELEDEGYEALRARLHAVDPEREAEINPNDAVRVMRALEVYEITGVPMSEHHRRDQEQRQSRNVRYVVLRRPRPAMMERIERRVDVMIAEGWVDEAARLMQRDLPDDSQACKALGYRELFRHLRGEWSLEEAIAEIKKQTRRFAKRQLTWFRGVPEAEWIDIEERSASDVARILQQSDRS
ncbi:tRNA (adenosine(37)-N6)-dimethylallyltransferase MiaA [bacterium]|nr:tRNA (adenosine(37)-N6)-dimethylallyltransferase MiaA [bacterium]